MNKQENINTNTLDLLPAAVILFDNEKVYFLNKKAIEVFNVPKNKLKNIGYLSIYSFLDPAYYNNFRKRAKLILKGHEFPEIELPFINFKKQPVYLEGKSNAVTYNGKTVIQTIFTDISGQVAYRDELTEAQETLDLISKNANDIIFFYTYYPKPKYTYISPSIKKVLGYSDKEFFNNSNLCLSISEIA